jgi:hypothetical protein
VNLAKKLSGAGGRLLDAAEVDGLTKVLTMPPALVEIMKKAPLIGVQLSLSDDDDRSGMGAEIQWMDPGKMISEATEVYPGILAAKRGYIPVGMCLEGSGDSYFYRASDGAIVRIPHDGSTEEELDEESIEVVARSLEELVKKAEIESA